MKYEMWPTSSDAMVLNVSKSFITIIRVRNDNA